MERIKLSVRNLVEFILREGDIDNRRDAGQKEEAMQEGSRMHRKIQKQMGASYRAEVPLSYVVSGDRYALVIEGRADGIIDAEEGFIIDEIKCMYRNVFELKEPIGVHLAQAKCYAFMYGEESGVSEETEIDVQLTYCNLETELIHRLRQTFSFGALKEWFLELVKQYQKWADWEFDHREQRNASIAPMEFPFAYRSGQRDMTASVYSAIKRGENLFVQAPTGIGKTMAAIFPAMKAIGGGMGQKVFYLTAKTSLAQVAMQSFRILKEQGMRCSTISITAKEKCCVNGEVECNPDACPYAKGHFDRVNDAIFALITKEDIIGRELLGAYAEQYQVCPFELSLDVSLFMDGIICDYNYAFDPRVSLKRYFADGQKGDYIFLVDEAHNLVERARSMYSAAVAKEDVLHVKRLLEEDFSGKFKAEADKKALAKRLHINNEQMRKLETNERKLIGALEKCNKELLQLKKECNDYVVLEDITPFALKVLSLLSAYENYLEDEKELPERETVLQLYFDLLHFSNMYELMDYRTVIYSELAGSRFLLHLYCVDPSSHLQSRLHKARATVFFSATMLPIHYYKELLSNEETDKAIYIPSPFEKEKRLLLVGKDVSSKYSMRSREQYQKICRYIDAVCGEKSGNYMVFFPSYQMLGDVYDVCEQEGLCEKYPIIAQSSFMKESERQEFLERFREDDEVVAFCILGGIFSEGIDLVKNRLIGTIVVGTGIPMVCTEREIVRQYFEQEKGNGFDYAYRYPGMNKVEQAAGRVIRSEEDEGVIVLLDTRFCYEENVQLFPVEWSDYRVTNLKEVGRYLAAFWEKEKG